MKDGGKMNRLYHQGDIVYADAEPHKGTEIGGHNPQEGNIRRPFIVISNYKFNRLSKLSLCYPVTHNFYDNRFGYIPFIDNDSKIKGSIILIKPVFYDLNQRNAKIVGHLNNDKLLDQLIAAMKNILKKIND